MLGSLRAWPLALTLAVTLACANVADATMANALSLAELTDQADVVVVGSVTGQHARRDEHGRIVTDVRIAVEESVRGDAPPGDEIVLVRIGGALDGIGMRIEGE